MFRVVQRLIDVVVNVATIVVVLGLAVIFVATILDGKSQPACKQPAETVVPYKKVPAGTIIDNPKVEI